MLVPGDFCLCASSVGHLFFSSSSSSTAGGSLPAGTGEGKGAGEKDVVII